MEELCCLHGQQLVAGFGVDHPAYLRYMHGLAVVNLAFGTVERAKTLLREVFDRRERVFGETHSKTLTFIDDLLQTYCETILQEDDDDDSAEPQFKPPPRSRSKLRRRPVVMQVQFLDSLLLDELVELCLDNEAYKEVDGLVQECHRFPHKTTARDSPDEDYRNWAQFGIKPGCQIQLRLASFKVPDADFYWEDSRMYMRTWRNVTMTAPRPKLPACGGAMPARILLTDEGLP
jgi:hypothetical protein